MRTDDEAGGGPDAARETLRRAVVGPGRWVVAGATGLSAAGLDPPAWVQLAPMVASVVLFGLPHGAVDHLVAPRLLGLPPRAGPIGAVVLAYLAVAGAYLAAWFAAPLPSFGFFIALTWYHWGQGDLHALLDLDRAAHLRTRADRAGALLIRGGLPMLVPLLAFPATYREVATWLAAPFGGGSPPPIGAEARAALGLGFGALVLVQFLRTARDRRPGSRATWRLDLAETLGLAAYFALVPPLLAIGLYFCLWHSTRHIARLVLLDPRSRADLRRGRLGPPLARFARSAAPTTLAALALLAGLAAAVPNEPGNLPELAALYLVLIAALTLPHALVVTGMDLAQGVWSPRPAGRPRG